MFISVATGKCQFTVYRGGKIRLWLLMLFVAGLCLPASAKWSVETVDAYGVMGSTPAIDLDSDDHPRIAYNRSGYGAKYAEYDGSSWNTEYVYMVSYGDCAWFDMVTDNEDVSHISFSLSSWGSVFYALQNPESGEWIIDWITSPSGSCWTSLDLNTQGDPCITFSDSDGSNWFLFWNGADWVSEFIDEGCEYWGCNSLVIDNDNLAHVAYSTDLSVTGVKYAVRNGYGEWETAIVDTSMSSLPKGVSLALSGNGFPRISYNVSGELRYAAWNGSSWNIETIDATDTGAREYDTSLALDQFDRPYIAHCNSAGDSLQYSFNPGTGWQTESICSLEGIDRGNPDLILDSMGRPHIAFTRDGSQMYAFNDEPLSVDSHEWVTGDTDMTGIHAASNPFSGSVNIHFSLSEASSVKIAVYDLCGREVFSPLSDYRSSGEYQIQWTPEASVPAGEYIMVLNAQGTVASELIVFLK
jgi:hypothetical protein